MKLRKVKKKKNQLFASFQSTQRNDWISLYDWNHDAVCVPSLWYSVFGTRCLFISFYFSSSFNKQQRQNIRRIFFKVNMYVQFFIICLKRWCSIVEKWYVVFPKTLFQISQNCYLVFFFNNWNIFFPKNEAKEEQKGC